MTRRLPNTNEVIAQVKAEAARRVFEKQATVPPASQYETGVATSLHKLASILRGIDLDQVTYDDVRQFVASVRTA